MKIAKKMKCLVVVYKNIRNTWRNTRREKCTLVDIVSYDTLSIRYKEGNNTYHNIWFNEAMCILCMLIKLLKCFEILLRPHVIYFRQKNELPCFMVFLLYFHVNVVGAKHVCKETLMAIGNTSWNRHDVKNFTWDGFALQGYLQHSFWTTAQNVSVI